MPVCSFKASPASSDIYKVKASYHCVIRKKRVFNYAYKLQFKILHNLKYNTGFSIILVAHHSVLDDEVVLAELLCDLAAQTLCKRVELLLDRGACLLFLGG